MSAVHGAGVGGGAREPAEPDPRRPDDLADPIDADLRRRVATDLGTTFLVEAGAGTGKTQVLVDRYLACLSADEAPPIAGVVAITFTEKAAGELRQRIRAELERLVAGAEPSAPVRERLSLALSGLDDAPISTIHAFAARLLRERPVEAAVDPAFEQLDQVGSELLGERLWRDWLSGLLDADRPDGDQPNADRPDRAGPASQLTEILRAGVPIEQIAQLARTRFAERFAVADCDPPAPPDLAALIAAAKAGAVSLAAAARDCADDTDRLKRGSLDLAAEAAALPDAGDLHELGRALIIAAGRTGPFTRKNAGKAVNWPGGKELMLADRDVLRDRVADAAGVYGAYIAGLALAVAADFARTAAAAQTEAGVLDFDDLLGRARDLLAGAAGADPAEVARVRGSFQRRYRFLLVDEFQDTDSLQAEIAFLLAEREPTSRSWRDVELRPGKLFLVGDPKQSIYRFRRADIAMYHEVAALVAGQGGEVVTLRQNFRTVASVVSWVNHVFAGLLVSEPGLQPGYAALSPYRADGEPGRNVVVVRAPADIRREGAAHAPTPAELCRHEAGVVAGLLSDMDRLGWMVCAGQRAGGGWRRATPGDVALLLPTFTHVGYYEQALREAGLPYRVEGGRTFFGRREVLDTLAVLHALDAAADPVAVYAALHGQLFAFSDDDLYAFHAAGGVFDYLGAALPKAFPEIAAALADLRELHERRNLRPPAETLDDLVRRTGLLESLALWADDPKQAIGNIGELISLADEFADSAEATFHAFVAKSRRDVAAADTAESPVGEAGEFVRLLTVHKAKGLEFPIVVLAAAMLTPRGASRDPLVDRSARRLDCSLSGESPDPDGAGATVRFQSVAYEDRFERERQALEAERRRLLYVALTRAADLLVLPVVTNEPRQGSLQTLWQGALEGGGAPAGAFMRVEERAAETAPAQPAPSPPPAADPLAGREAWRSERAALLARASRPAPIFAPSALERLEPPDWLDRPVVAARPSAPEAAPAETAVSGAPASGGAPGEAGSRDGPEAGTTRRPLARERALALGTAVHLVLERVSLSDDATLDERAARAATRVGLDGDAERVAALARACWRAAPLRAAAGSVNYRELPVCARHGATLIEGAIDLVYRDDELGGWVVVDYKTDTQLPPDAVRIRYGGQAGAYALAFEAAGGGRVVAVDVLLAARPDAAGAATVVRLPYDPALRELVETRLREGAGLVS